MHTKARQDATDVVRSPVRSPTPVITWQEVAEKKPLNRMKRMLGGMFGWNRHARGGSILGGSIVVPFVGLIEKRLVECVPKYN